MWQFGENWYFYSLTFSIHKNSTSLHLCRSFRWLVLILLVNVFCSFQHKNRTHVLLHLHLFLNFWSDCKWYGILNFDVLTFTVVNLYDIHSSIQKYNWFLYADLISWDLAEFTYSRRVLGLFCILSSFVVDSSGIPTQTIKSSTNRDSFISYFPVCVSFISFPCLTVLAKTCIMMLNKMVVSVDFPVLFPLLGGHTQSFTINYNGRCWLCWYSSSVSKWRSSSLVPFFWVLIMDACWIWSNAFSVSIDVIMWFSFFSLLR